MTMEEIVYRTPNGLHDAYLLNLDANYREQVLRFDLNWFVGIPDGSTEEEREGFREGTLIVRGLKYLVIESPTKAKGYEEPSHIDGFVTRPEDEIRMSLPSIAEGGFRYSIFIGEWNSFIHFAGTSAEVTPADLIVREMRA
ncbi:MAG TPA: hypothetical protein VGU46_00205 [Acidobacteriaceae bacterium]|nr:hypothetical protein [Acidobacteriaceae bacterium]